MNNRPFRFGPLALTATLTTNIFNCALGSLSGPVGFSLTQPYVLLHHVLIVNKTGAPVNASLWIGATGANAAGTEWRWQAQPIGANSHDDWYGEIRLDSTDFLVGGGSATGLTIQGEGEIGFA